MRAATFGKAAVVAFGLVLLLPAQTDQPSSRANLESTQDQADEGKGGQTDEERAEEQKLIAKLIRAAREGRTVVRPQAAIRLASMGRPAAAELLSLAGEDNESLAALGKDLVGVLAQINEPKLRAKLWAASEDVDFPWRPSAAKSLAASPLAEELPNFVAWLNDPLSLVRMNAVRALVTLDSPDARKTLNLVRQRLSDPDDKVRREAAAALDTWGQPDALAWPLEELQRTDTFFDLNTARLARNAAWELLRDRIPGVEEQGIDYNPNLPPDDPANQAAFTQLKAKLAERTQSAASGYIQLSKLPELALSKPAVHQGHELIPGNDQLGLELRSCRRGEFFLRWASYPDTDILWVGTGHPIGVTLPKGTTARLQKLAATQVEKLEGERFFGQPGCDSEALLWRPTPDEHPRTIQVSKGQALQPNLRPEALAELYRTMLATLPNSEHQDPRLDQLQSRTKIALRSLGGEL